MNRKYIALLFTAAFILPVICSAQVKNKFSPKPGMVKLINKNLADATKQYKILMQHVPADSLAGTFEKNKWVSVGASNWVSGFYPGTLFLLYQATKDADLYNAGLSKLKVMEPEQTINSHDIGFMMYDSYGVINRLRPDPAYKKILLTSAASLIKRFNPVVGCTMSWSSQPGHFRVIIDNMMNLELLMWATKISGDSTYAKVAISHANTVMKNHFRPDYSSYHLVDYNPETGAVIKKQTVQGYSDESAWARGQGWGLYGFTMMYRETKDPKYLAQANHIANFILSSPNLPADKVPYWDFDAPGKPNIERDASAGAIYASALIELAHYTDAVNAKRYMAAAETILRTLSSPAFKAPTGENGGFILEHSVGHKPKNVMVNVPLSYADYYFVEAMLRYKQMDKNID